MSPTTSGPVLKAVIFDVCIDSQLFPPHPPHPSISYNFVTDRGSRIIKSIHCYRTIRARDWYPDRLSQRVYVGIIYLYIYFIADANSGPGIPLLVQKEVLVVPGRGSNAENSPCLIFIETLGMTCPTLSTEMYGTRNTV